MVGGLWKVVVKRCFKRSACEFNILFHSIQHIIRYNFYLYRMSSTFVILNAKVRKKRQKSEPVEV